MGHIFNDAVTFNGAAAFNGSTSGVTASTANNTELNLIGNPSSATGWSVVNTAGSNPMAVATTVTAGDLPLSGSIANAIKFTSRTVAGAEASEYVTYSFTTPASLSGKMKIEFYMRTGANFANSEWTVSVYQSTTRQVLSTDVSGATTLPLANGKFTTTVDLLASTAYTLRFARPTNAGTNAAVLNVANVIVGPGIQPQGAVVSGPFSYTPTTDGFGTISGITSFYSRRGSFLKVQGRVDTGTVNGNTAYVSLPSGLNVDSSVIISNIIVGKWWRLNAGATTRKTGALATDYTTNANILRFTNDDYTAGVAVSTSLVGSAVAGTGEVVWFDFEVPIAEWAGSGTVNLAQNDVEYAYNTSSATTGDDSTSFGYGPEGAAFPSITSAGLRRVRFQKPIQNGDIITLQVRSSSTAPWIDLVGQDSASGIISYVLQNSVSYGITPRLSSVNSTDIDISIGQYCYPSGATYGAAGAAWSTLSAFKWRVRKSSAGAAVGFGIADTTTSGLVPSGTHNKSTGAWTLGTSGGSLIHNVYGNRMVLTDDTTAGYAHIRFFNGANVGGIIGAQGTTDGQLISGLTDDNILVLSGANGIAFSGNIGGAVHGLMSSAGAWQIGAVSFLGTHSIRGNVSQSANSFTLTAASTSPFIKVETTVSSSTAEIIADSSSSSGVSPAMLTLRGNGNSNNYINSSANRGLLFIENGVTGTVLGSMGGGAWTLGNPTKTVTHRFESGITSGSMMTQVVKTTNGDTASNYYMEFATNTASQGYIWNNASGNLELVTSSDLSLKTNIRNADYGLAEILSLRPVVFDWISGKAENTKGFIAQEVELVLPECVSEGQDGLKMLGKDAMIPVLVKAIQELKAKNDALESRLAALEN